jgi:hypothetical protein
MVRIMRLTFAFFLTAIIISIAAFPENMKPEEIAAHHLNSIGTQEARAAIKSRLVQGTLKMHVLVGGGGEVTGTWGRVSEQRQSNFVMRFAAGGDWRGEQFIFDGERTGFATATSSNTRSVFAQFVSSHDYIVKEGLLGGELSTAWALQNLDSTHAKLESIGRRKIDGRELIGLQYFSKSGSDMQIRLYFDPDTFQHVMTEYTLEFAQGLGHDVSDIRHFQNRYSIEERFSDFKVIDGLTLPTNYRLRYTEDVVNDAPSSARSQLGGTRVYDWDMTAEQIQHNLTLDAKNFRVK